MYSIVVPKRPMSALEVQLGGGGIALMLASQWVLVDLDPRWGAAGAALGALLVVAAVIVGFLRKRRAKAAEAR